MWPVTLMAGSELLREGSERGVATSGCDVCALGLTRKTNESGPPCRVGAVLPLPSLCRGEQSPIFRRVCAVSTTSCPSCLILARKYLKFALRLGVNISSCNRDLLRPGIKLIKLFESTVARRRHHHCTPHLSKTTTDQIPESPGTQLQIKPVTSVGNFGPGTCQRQRQSTESVPRERIRAGSRGAAHAHSRTRILSDTGRTK